MNDRYKILTVAAAMCVGLFTATASDKHDHKHVSTPKGGRILDKTEPMAEFVVEKDRSVTIHFYSDDLKPLAATTQVVTAIANTKGGKATLEFEKRGDSLVSKSKLPEGEGYNVVVQFRQTADAKPQHIRFKVDLHACGECKRQEYACVCDH